MPTEITDPERKRAILEALGTEEARQAISGVLESVPGRFAAGMAAPAVETAVGINELLRGQLSPSEQHLVREARKPGGLPKTAGRIAGEIGMLAAPSRGAWRLGQKMARGTPYLRSALPLATESVAIGGAEALRPPEEGQTRLARGGQAAGQALLGGAALGAVSRIISPRMFGTKDLVPEEVEFLKQMDVSAELPLALRARPEGAAGSVLEWAHADALRAVPGLGTALVKQTDEALNRWREAILRTALPQRLRDAVPMPSARLKAEAPVRETFGDIQDWYSKQYKEVLDPHSFPIAKGPTLKRLTSAVDEIPVETARTQVSEILADLIQGYANKGGFISGSGISDMKRSLYDAVKETDSGEVKRGLFRVLDTLEDLVLKQIARVNPEHAFRYKELAAPYRNLKVLEDAATRRPGGQELGEFLPKDVIAASIGKVRREGGLSRAAAQRGPLQKEAERAAKVYGPATTEKQRSFWKGATLMGGLGVGTAINPIIGGGATALTLGSAHPAVQRYLAGRTPTQQTLQPLMESPWAREMARALRIISGTSG